MSASIRNEIRQVVQASVRNAADLPLPELTRIGRLVPEQDLDITPVERALSAALVDKHTPFLNAARRLLGMTDDTRHAKLGARQVAAAREIPISARHFRRPGSYQDRVIDAICAALESISPASDPQIENATLNAFQLERQIHIRPAVASDESFVVELMDSALAPYYGGDHRAHAERIFTTHIAGGADALGFFSREQKMFIATLGSEPDAPQLGMLHLVGKRQGTYKISPLIVAPEVRRKLHVGSLLMRFAEEYARRNHARELYCTVSEENVEAVQFYLRSGFVAAGRSFSHYKPGLTETMLYKALVNTETITLFDTPNISVTPMENVHKEGVKELLLSTLPEHFAGIDEEWVGSLFAGYERRHEADVNRKYKLIFVATDRRHRVLGVAAATPKKGQPIKIMPLIASDVPSFSALITDIPYQLRPYGRKVYAHVAPGPSETMTLQARGWRLDAALPAAYHTDHVTQQWSLDIDAEDLMRTMRVKQRYLDYIKAGTKPLEVRVAYDSMRTIQTGERIRFMSRDDSQVIVVRDVRRYRSFGQMAEHERLEHVIPGRPAREVLATLRAIYPPDRERLGVVVLDVQPA